MTARARHPETHPPAYGAALLVCLLVTAAMAYVHIAVYPSYMVSLTYALPLLLAVWHRRLTLLWGMAAVFVVVSAYKCFNVLPGALYDFQYRWAAWCMQLVNLLVVSGTVHLVILLRERLERRNRELADANAELEAGNEELVAREQVITTQNEELQTQTEELEQQSDELRGFAEELQQLNDVLHRREALLQALLDVASTPAETEPALEHICAAAARLLGPAAAAVAMMELQGDELVVRASSTRGDRPPLARRWAFNRSFAALILERNQTGYLEDVEQRPDLQTLQPVDGARFCSLLVTPLRIGGVAIGAVEAYSEAPYQWTTEQFRLIEWAASRCGVILEVLRLRADLETRQREAEEASQRKTRFLAAVSHDIRTPANAITLLAELIARVADEGVSPGVTLPELTRDLKANSRALVELVTDVLDVTRFDAGQQEITLSAFALRAALEAEVRQLLPMAQAKGLALELLVAPSAADLVVHTDRLKFARVLTNLIGNALKFTETGCVRVEAERRPDGGVGVKVVDTGAGISAEHQRHIFDEFFQLRNPERDRNKGTGLGLAICKRLVAALGCTLSVQSRLGQGSTFTVGVPARLIVVAPAAPAPPRPSAPTTPPPTRAALPDLQGIKVLLVEDHEVTRRATAHLLTDHGAEVLQVPDGRAALRALAHAEPDIVLLDLMLPDMDGHEVLRAIRARRPAAPPYVLAVTGDVTPLRRTEVLNSGADGFLRKPVDPQELIRLLRQPELLLATAADEPRVPVQQNAADS